MLQAFTDLKIEDSIEFREDWSYFIVSVQGDERALPSRTYDAHWFLFHLFLRSARAECSGRGFASKELVL